MATYPINDENPPTGAGYRPGDIVVCPQGSVVPRWKYVGDEQWVPANVVEFVENEVTGGIEIFIGDRSAVVADFPSYPVQVVCQANATTTANGTVAGLGDVIGKIDYVVNTPGSTATLAIQDGTGTTYTINPTGGYSLAGNGSVSLGYISTVGAWKVICGAGLSAVASLM